MARPIILSNGEMAIGLNPFGLVHDFYYPYVGLENHSSERASRHRVGLFVEGAIHWITDGTWQISQRYLPGRLIGKTVATNEWLGFAIEFQDFVDSELNVFARNVEVINLGDRERSAKLYMHQAFIISEAADGHDTAQYIPKGATPDHNHEAILHYKGKRCFLIGGENLQKGTDFDSFSIGTFGQFHDGDHEGVWRDAEDGELARNPVERVQTDSIMQFDLDFQPHDSARVHYHLAAGKSLHEVRRALAKFRSDTLLTRLMKTGQYWAEWIEPAAAAAEVKIAPEYRENFLSSLLTLKSMMDRRGAVMASIDTEMLKYTRDAYVDCWPRDASYTYWAFLRLGYYNELKQFFRFARDVLTEEGFFWQMYRPDASVGPNSHAYVHDGDVAPPIQSDETATTLFLFVKAVQQAVRSGEKLEGWSELWENLGRPMANFLSDFIDPITKLPRPSYELWEVAYETSTYTTAATYGALNAAADLAEMFHETDNVIKWRNVTSEIREHADMLWNEKKDFFYKGFWRRNDGRTDFDDRIDASSFYAAWAFNLFDRDKVAKAFEIFTQRFNIDSENIASPRFEGDDYNRVIPNSDGNPWFIISFWLAQYQLDEPGGDREFARKVLDWANDQITRTNILPEQVSPLDGSMISAAPLAWSHAEFINTCLDFGIVDKGEDHEIST
ncbi:glycoside hydrolase family 15 protein [Candidatus Saccharibacteria bacterium]|nr:glycoside hydrolase family 15 protein [Candidatus Saccharibacteria bacterium]